MTAATGGTRYRESIACAKRRVMRSGAYCAAAWAIAALLSGCASIALGGSSSEEGAAADRGEGVETVEERVPLFQTSEDYWVHTPWFSVSSIVVRVRTTQPRTIIILPESSIMRDYMMNDRNVVFDADSIPHRMRFLLGLGLKTGDIEPFFDSDRIERPEEFE
ncbi:MAG: hypothetical protein MI724_21305 [Spirochaetales bacterium]|nr:hypothetical protein [Spirochaetales bacterium]